MSRPPFRAVVSASQYGGVYGFTSCLMLTCAASVAGYGFRSPEAPVTHVRCSYCGRTQRIRDDGQCLGCGAPLPYSRPDVWRLP
jgi:hypothetical protein